MPTRTCVICRKKDDKANLLRFVIINKEVVYDLNHRIKTYGFYICNINDNQHTLTKFLNSKNAKRKNVEV